MLYGARGGGYQLRYPNGSQVGRGESRIFGHEFQEEFKKKKNRKRGRGGSKVVWTFSGNSAILPTLPF